LTDVFGSYPRSLLFSPGSGALVVYKRTSKDIKGYVSVIN